jgi:endonuclease G
VSPQRHEFNAGIWNDLEQQVRRYALDYGDLYVVTGPILKSGLKTIASEKVSVPEAFYKITYLQNNDGGKMRAWFIPTNKRSTDLNDFIVTVDQIEEMTGCDFFSQLEDGVEEKLEKELNSGF